MPFVPHPQKHGGGTCPPVPHPNKAHGQKEAETDEFDNDEDPDSQEDQKDPLDANRDIMDTNAPATNVPDVSNPLTEQLMNLKNSSPQTGRVCPQKPTLEAL